MATNPLQQLVQPHIIEEHLCKMHVRDDKLAKFLIACKCGYASIDADTNVVPDVVVIKE